MKKALSLLAFIISIGTAQPASADWTEWRLPAQKEEVNQPTTTPTTAGNSHSKDYSQWVLPPQNQTIPTEIPKKPLYTLERLEEEYAHLKEYGAGKKAALSNLVLAAKAAPFNFAKDAYEGYKNPDTCTKQQRIAYEKLIKWGYTATALSCVTITSLTLISIRNHALAIQAERARRAAQEREEQTRIVRENRRRDYEQLAEQLQRMAQLGRDIIQQEMQENRRRALEQLNDPDYVAALEASLAQNHASAPIVQNAEIETTAMANRCKQFNGLCPEQQGECSICCEDTNINFIPCKNEHTDKVCANCLLTIDRSPNNKCPICRAHLFTN